MTYAKAYSKAFSWSNIKETAADVGNTMWGDFKDAAEAVWYVSNEAALAYPPVAGGEYIIVKGAGYVWNGAKWVKATITGSKEVKVSIQVLSKGERIKIFNQRLLDAPSAKSADEALAQLDKIMTEVEDAYSGVAKVDHPGLAYQGRMYAPRPDKTARMSDGSIRAVTSGNFIEITADGTIKIFAKNADKTQGALVLTKPGAGG